MAMAPIQGTGEEYRISGTDCLDWGTMLPSGLATGSSPLSVITLAQSVEYGNE
jgi:hypothetical protein